MTSKIQRRLAMVGLTMFAGATLGLTAGPASAATVDHRPGNTVTHPGHGGFHFRPVRGYVYVDTFDSRRRCVRAGLRGQDRGMWDEFLCVRTERDNHHGWGSHHGWGADYALLVQRRWHRGH
jgi:hypothetical protein